MNRRTLLGGAAGATALTAGGAALAMTNVERLGHPKDARLLMLHADDAGMCRSVNLATMRAMKEGVASSASVMVPCPWFPQMAEWSRENPRACLGLHLTLTSEWKLYRWRPVAPITQVKGLLDEQGFMWRNVEGVKRHASAEEVEIEIRAQIERARQFGMKPTHVDSHMGTLFSDPKFFEVYTRVSRDLKVIPMIPAPTPDIEAEARELGLDYGAVTRRLAGQGYVVLDRLSTGLKGDTYETRKQALFEFVRGLKPGVTKLIVHLSGDEDEVRHITGSWPTRSNETRLMLDPAVREFLADQQVKLIGYQDLHPLAGPAFRG
jgi:predicted glycoside hydrolase/deacetylase ChbG (UPF0249 family)